MATAKQPKKLPILFPPDPPKLCNCDICKAVLSASGPPPPADLEEQTELQRLKTRLDLVEFWIRTAHISAPDLPEFIG